MGEVGKEVQGTGSFLECSWKLCDVSTGRRVLSAHMEARFEAEELLLTEAMRKIHPTVSSALDEVVCDLQRYNRDRTYFCVSCI